VRGAVDLDAVVAALAAIPTEWRANRRGSLYWFVRRSGYRRARRRLSESVLQAHLAHYLSTHPDGIRAWLGFCEDKRTTAGYAIVRDEQGWRVYKPFPSKPAFRARSADPGERFDDVADACACFILRECDVVSHCWTPAAGAGNLETTSSEDDYDFTTTASGSQRLELPCSGDLGSVNWRLTNVTAGTAVDSDSGCGYGQTFQNLPAADYELAVTAPGTTGTYALSFGPPQTFNVTLPATVADGVPSSGAGRLERSTSEDVYQFHTARDGDLIVGLSACSSTPSWTLRDTESGAAIQSGSGCSSQTVPNLVSGDYSLSVTGEPGTFDLALQLASP
jgi:hypothetical protein